MPTRMYCSPDGGTSGHCGAGGTGGLWKVAKSLAAGGQSDGRLGGGPTSGGTPIEERLDGAAGHWPCALTRWSSGGSGGHFAAISC